MLEKIVSGALELCFAGELWLMDTFVQRLRQKLVQLWCLPPRIRRPQQLPHQPCPRSRGLVLQKPSSRARKFLQYQQLLTL